VVRYSGFLVFETSAHIYLLSSTSVLTGSTVDLVLVDSGSFCFVVSGSESETVAEVSTDFILLFLFCLSHVLLVNLNHGLF
jgi:hypothetical protein